MLLGNAQCNQNEAPPHSSKAEDHAAHRIQATSDVHPPSPLSTEVASC